MNTLEEITALVHKTFGIAPEKLEPNRPLADYGLDSLAAIELLFAIEEHFELSLPETHQGIDTLAGLATVVDELRLRQAA